MYSPFRLLLSLTAAASFLLPSKAADWTPPHDLQTEEQAPVSLIPFPTEVKWGSLKAKLKWPSGPGTSLPVLCKGNADSYKNTLDALKNRLGIRPVPVTSGPSPLTLELSPALEQECGKEGYRLDIKPTGATLRAATDTGLFYAVQTLGQLSAKKSKGHLSLPAVSIQDKPAFAHRGFMHDTGRNYRTLDSLKSDLDKLSQLKINVFHWHLTDNPAWRPESKLYPQLNDPKLHQKDRDQGEKYTFDQIRDLISYARDRHILVIPELDMPGHSAFFKRTFGCEMASPEGMDILEKLLDEFCREIPQKDCPIVHIGTDEVHVKNPREFVDRMAKKVNDLGRTPMQWKPGLPIAKGSIAQLWSEGDPVTRPENKDTPFFDSSFGYLNGLDNPYLTIQRYFFKQLGGRSHGDEQALGPLLCLWPDARVDDKAKIQRHSPMWPALLAFAERAWQGCPQDGSAYGSKLPPKGSEARTAFELFEKRMVSFGKNYTDFPYFAQSSLSWKVTQPVSTKNTEKVKDMRRQMLSNHPETALSSVDGACLMLRPRTTGEGLYPKQEPGVTVWAKMDLTAPKAGKQRFIVGFDAPSRSSRKCSGIPQNGQWSAFGAKIWINGQEIPGPNWKNPGANRHTKDTWFDPANEIPYEDEEFWWTREPVELPLKKGRNTILVEIPYEGAWQAWNASLIPVKKDGTHWVTDEQIKPASS